VGGRAALRQAFPILGVSLLAVAGCGGSSTTPTSETAEAAAAAAAARRVAEDRAPRGASPTLRAIYAQFPPPNADPGVQGSSAAISAGRRACAGKTPLQVKSAYYPIAIERGALRPDSAEAKMIDRIASFQRNVASDQSFVAGQLAADAYQATLPPATAQYGYQGCVYSLVLRLERELAPGG
jgi:hypothetical protein